MGISEQLLAQPQPHASLLDREALKTQSNFKRKYEKLRSKGMQFLLLLTQENNKSDFLLQIPYENTFLFLCIYIYVFSNKWQFKNEIKL